MNTKIFITLSVIVYFVTCAPDLAFVHILFDEGEITTTDVFLGKPDGPSQPAQVTQASKNGLTDLGTQLGKYRQTFTGLLAATSFGQIKGRPSSTDAIKAYSNSFFGSVATTEDIDRQNLDPNYPCAKRDALMKLAEKASDEYNGLLFDQKFEIFLNKASKYTKTTVTESNYLEVMEGIDRETTKYSFKTGMRLIAESKDFRLKSTKMRHGDFNSTVKVGDLDVGKEIKRSRISTALYEIKGRFNKYQKCIEAAAKCPNNIKDKKMFLFATTSPMIRLLLSALGLPSELTKLDDFGPQNGEAIKFEIFNDNTFKMEKKIGNDTSFVDVTKGIAGCDGKDYCDMKVFESDSYQVGDKFNCKVSDPDLYTMPTIPPTKAPTKPPMTKATPKPVAAARKSSGMHWLLIACICLSPIAIALVVADVVVFVMGKKRSVKKQGQQKPEKSKKKNKKNKKTEMSTKSTTQKASTK